MEREMKPYPFGGCRPYPLGAGRGGAGRGIGGGILAGTR